MSLQKHSARKAPSTPATMSKQHCRMLQVERRHCWRFWQQYRKKFRPLDKVKQIEHVQFVLTLSKGRNFTKNSFETVAQNGNNVEATFNFVERTIFYDKLVQNCCQRSRMLLRRCCWCRRGLRLTFCLYLRQMFIVFNYSFTSRLSGRAVVRWSLKIWPNVRRIAAAFYECLNVLNV